MLHNLLSFLGKLPPWEVLSMAPAALLFGYIIRQYVRALLSRPRFRREDIVYQEFFASGASQRNILTKLGGGRNCVRLLVTPDLLWVTSWFPFSVLAAAYDMVHVIPRASITSLEPARSLFSDPVTAVSGSVWLLSYIDPAGDRHTLKLMPRNRERFLAALRHPR